MKLIKSRLIKITKKGLEDLGYQEFRDSITPAQGLFIKSIKNHFYLSLGLTISKYYEGLFTASFYLSKVTTWATVGSDIPNDSYQRVGSFLLKEERKKLLPDEFSAQQSEDAWWNIENENTLVDFLETVRITEQRFLDQPDLFNKIRKSRFVSELEELSKKVINDVASNKIHEDHYRFVPAKPIDEIPLEWFKVAEKVIKEKKATLNFNTVKRLAADAFRQSKCR